MARLPLSCQHNHLRVLVHRVVVLPCLVRSQTPSRPLLNQAPWMPAGKQRSIPRPRSSSLWPRRNSASVTVKDRIAKSRSASRRCWTLKKRRGNDGKPKKSRRRRSGYERNMALMGRPRAYRLEEIRMGEPPPGPHLAPNHRLARSALGHRQPKGLRKSHSCSRRRSSSNNHLPSSSRTEAGAEGV